LSQNTEKETGAVADEGEWEIVCGDCGGCGRFKGVLFPIVVSLIAIAITWFGWANLSDLAKPHSSRHMTSIFLGLFGGPYLLYWAWRRTYLCDTCNGSGFRVKTLDEYLRESDNLNSAKEPHDVKRSGVRWVLKTPRRFPPDLQLLYERIEELAANLIRDGRKAEGEQLKTAMFGTTSGEALGNLQGVLIELRADPLGLDTKTMIVAMGVLHDVELLLRPR
jgi:hypothetical protein